MLSRKAAREDLSISGIEPASFEAALLRGLGLALALRLQGRRGISFDEAAAIAAAHRALG